MDWQRFVYHLWRPLTGYVAFFIAAYVVMYLLIWLWFWPEAQGSFISVRFTQSANEQMIVPARHVFWYPLVGVAVVVGNIGLSLALQRLQRYDTIVRRFWYHWIMWTTMGFSLLVAAYIVIIILNNTN